MGPKHDKGFGWDRYDHFCPLYSPDGLPDWGKHLEQTHHGCYEDDGSRNKVFGRGVNVGPPAPAAAAAQAAVVVAAILAGDEGPKPEKEAKTFVEIALVDTEGKPVGNAKYRATLSDGAVREGALDGGGKARLDGIPPGEVQVSFPEFHGPDWGA